MDRVTTQVPLATPADVAAYRRDGVVCLRGVFAEIWREIAARGLERNLRDRGHRAQLYAGGNGKPRFFQDSCSWWRIPEFLDYCFNSPAAAIAGALMGARRVNLFFDNVMLKDPGANAPTPWHQDVPYWPVTGDQVCSVWMPLDPITSENRLEFVRGSHSWGRNFTPMDFHQPGKAKDIRRPDFEPIPDFNALRDRFEFVSFDMEPGDCLVFHGAAVHGAPGNMTSRPRRAMISRWTGDDARYAGDKHARLAPPFPRCGLASGDPMTCETFPVVWEASGPC
jgi:ectoine hydroxylase-related dioxygenase (phytanoyl-CoA dioxygenase family)